ncbi:hypothetical protein JCM21714_120 [Gracilibacillus boraciitolerans JCM 21714]|uniref:DUF2624 domain-containing protein n=1 Tax=Gracilibacillus boraciitolerans JCM 21714 TaxID=1298598 RepID=W4VEJ7_9BACI|nr:DUF2624 family protein [Gracilibacillus boraciitolerans]GAE91179.1 hypothetical protein JCM21714_120 [Gracilibacillus boraciitolerans JCM 21714]
MNEFTKRIMMNKLKELTAKEVLEYSQKFHLTISKTQAQAITNHLKNSKFDPTISEDRVKMFKKLAKITDMETANACQQLFQKLIKEYRIEHYFH